MTAHIALSWLLSLPTTTLVKYGSLPVSTLYSSLSLCLTLAERELSSSSCLCNDFQISRRPVIFSLKLKCRCCHRAFCR